MRIRLLREAGGIGDVAGCLGTARGVREVLPGAEIWFHVLAGYAELVEMSPDVDRVVAVTMDEGTPRDAVPNPRVHPTLRGHGRFDATVQLFCPGYRYEAETVGRGDLNRLDAWAAAASETLGVDVPVRVARLRASRYDAGRARGIVETVRAGRPLVFFQPLTMAPWRSMLAEQAVGIVDHLAARGATTIMLHDRDSARYQSDEVVLDAMRAKGVPILALPSIPVLVAALALADILVACDSGLFHLAACAGLPTVVIYGALTGRVACQHYPAAIPVDPSPEAREDLPCDRGCHRLGLAGWASERCAWGCAAQDRIDPARIAAAIDAALAAAGPNSA